jgi:hypothetical protein
MCLRSLARDYDRLFDLSALYLPARARLGEAVVPRFLTLKILTPVPTLVRDAVLDSWSYSDVARLLSLGYRYPMWR